MKDQDYELLSQFIDGELPAEASQELRGRLLAEPELRATYERLRKLDGRIRETFNAPGTDTVPSRVTSLLERRKNSADRKHAGWGFAIAASLLAAAGLLLSPDWRQQQTGAPSLASVLESTPSSGAAWETLGDGRQVQPVLSFAHIDGTWCREYLLSDDGATYRGVACRNEGTWVTSALENQALPGSANAYRPAGAGDSDAVATFIADNASGIALSREQETALIARRWQ
jgi:hypothetical protein